MAVVSDFSKLRATLSGHLTEPSDSAYDQERHVWNGMIDRRPAAIALSIDVALKNPLGIWIKAERYMPSAFIEARRLCGAWLNRNDSFTFADHTDHGRHAGAAVVSHVESRS